MIGNDLLMIMMMMIFTMMVMMLMTVKMMLMMVTNEVRLPVIKRVGTFWVAIRPTHPTLDRMAWKSEIRNALFFMPR